MKTSLIFWGAAFLMAGPSAWAHHSFASEFDVSKPLNLRGKVVQVDWANPHASLQVAVTDKSGKASQWTIECGAPNVLLRNGVARDSLPKGAEVSVTGWQAKDKSLRASGSFVTLEDGRRLSLGSSHEEGPQISHAVSAPVPYPVAVAAALDDYAAPSAPVSAAQELSPVITIDQYLLPDTADPAIDDTDSPLPPLRQDETRPADRHQVMFLIAMKSHEIIPALAYWVDGDTVNYINPQGSKNLASIGLVDREFSMQLNKDRNLDFGLPK